MFDLGNGLGFQPGHFLVDTHVEIFGRSAVDRDVFIGPSVVASDWALLAGGVSTTLFIPLRIFKGSAAEGLRMYSATSTFDNEK